MNLAATLRINRLTLARMIVAGGAWGLTMSVGFFLIALTQCGAPCPDDVVAVTTTCIAAGIVMIGPLAAFYPRAGESRA